VPLPGEVNQLIGQAYQCVFIGALEANISYFENRFDVRTSPEKTSFKGRNGNMFSFDFSGTYRHPLAHAEVFGECKGYTKGAGLLPEFKTFLAKAYVTSFDYARNRRDYFWFVTNVPFACTEGAAILTYDFVLAALKDAGNVPVRQTLGESHIDETFVRTLIPRLGVFILTDSFLMNVELLYRVVPGESLWVILKKFHAGHVPSGFRFVAQQIASRNRLQSPDRIVAGKRIKLPWFGIGR
jgi:LysM domain